MAMVAQPIGPSGPSHNASEHCGTASKTSRSHTAAATPPPPTTLSTSEGLLDQATTSPNAQNSSSSSPSPPVNIVRAGRISFHHGAITPADRERNALLRTVSHLRKDDRSPTHDAQPMTEGEYSASVDDEATHESRAIRPPRPFHHSELAQPPVYTSTRSMRQRLSLDVRRPSRSTLFLPDEDSLQDSPLAGERFRSSTSHSQSAASSRSLRRFSRSQYNLSTAARHDDESHSQSPLATGLHTHSRPAVQAGARLRFCLEKLGLKGNSKGKSGKDCDATAMHNLDPSIVAQKKKKKNNNNNDDSTLRQEVGVTRRDPSNSSTASRDLTYRHQPSLTRRSQGGVSDISHTTSSSVELTDADGSGSDLYQSDSRRDNDAHDGGGVGANSGQSSRTTLSFSPRDSLDLNHDLHRRLSLSCNRTASSSDSPVSPFTPPMHESMSLPQSGNVSPDEMAWATPLSSVTPQYEHNVMLAHQLVQMEPIPLCNRKLGRANSTASHAQSVHEQIGQTAAQEYTAPETAAVHSSTSKLSSDLTTNVQLPAGQQASDPLSPGKQSGSFVSPVTINFNVSSLNNSHCESISRKNSIVGLDDNIVDKCKSASLSQINAASSNPSCDRNTDRRSDAQQGNTVNVPSLSNNIAHVKRECGKTKAMIADVNPLPALSPTQIDEEEGAQSLLKVASMHLSPQVNVVEVPSPVSVLRSQLEQTAMSRRPSASRGLDEEQAALESLSQGKAQEVVEATQTSANNGEQRQQQSSTDSSTTSFSNNASNRRPTARSSRLSHLPRLDSARNTSLRAGGSGGAGGSGDGNGNGGDDQHRRGTDAHDEGSSDDEPLDDAAAHIEDEEDVETEMESSDDAMSDTDDEETSQSIPGSLPLTSTGRSDSVASQSRQNNRPSGISLPPAPTFSYLETNPSDARAADSTSIQTQANTIAKQTNTALASKASGARAAASATADSGAEDEVFETPTATGRDSWMQFGSSEDTPGWLPTPRATAAATPTTATQAASGPSARMGPPSMPASSAAGEASYFNIQPNTSASTSQHAVRDRNAPPPSPSIITRSRAQSSASSLSMRTPTLPSRDLPVMPPIAPLPLRVGDRVKSPAPLLRKVTLPSPIAASPASGAAEQASPVASQSASQSSAHGSSSRPARNPIRPATASSAASPPPDSAPAGATSFAQANGFATYSMATKEQGGANTVGRGASSSLRPGLYKQESRSLIDLTSPARKQLEPTLQPLQRPHGDAHTVQEEESSATNAVQRSTSPAPSFASLGRRRRSMFEVGAAPPPYSVVHRGHDGKQMVVPREEEGSEALPDYTCSVHIEGYLPRKMEFSSPGVQAKDRSWKRQYFVLHGTCLRVYRADLSGDRGAFKGQYGAMAGSHVHFEAMNEDGPIGATPQAGTAGTGKVQGVNPRAPATKDVFQSSASSTLTSNTGSGGTTTRPASTHTSNGSTGSGGGHGGLSRTVEAALSGTISHINHPFSLPRNALIKQYTLQGAESGLAADYLKRRHVVRVRAEGEQFLLQTRNDRHVVDWIEAFQASTNVAMDLERRPMPKFITLPRRRRRRRRECERAGAASNGGSGGATNGAGTPASDLASREAADLEEARRRSLIDAGITPSGSPQHQRRRAAGAHNTASPNPPRPLGLPGDESPPDPSSAFEEMLRQEQEDQSSRDAGDV